MVDDLCLQAGRKVWSLQPGECGIHPTPHPSVWWENSEETGMIVGPGWHRERWGQLQAGSSSSSGVVCGSGWWWQAGVCVWLCCVVCVIIISHPTYLPEAKVTAAKIGAQQRMIVTGCCYLSASVSAAESITAKKKRCGLFDVAPATQVTAEHRAKQQGGFCVNRAEVEIPHKPVVCPTTGMQAVSCGQKKKQRKDALCPV